VLTRLADDSRALQRVARTALDICHYKPKTEQWLSQEDLVDQKAGDCEAGCYSCLMSYFNQPDHDQIDRKGEAFVDLLIQLVHGSYVQNAGDDEEAHDHFQKLLNITGSQLERDWLHWIRERGCRLPSRGGHYLKEFQTTPDFEYSDQDAVAYTVVYIDGPPHDTPAAKERDREITQRLEAGGITVIRFSWHTSTWQEIVQEYDWFFAPDTSMESV